MQKQRVAIFASGTGSNAMNLIRYFEGNERIEISFVLSNRESAPIIESAQAVGMKVFYFPNDKVADGEFLTSFCKEHHIDWIVLAGYLRLIPVELIKAYPNRIINLHPALLPNYGGKGMFGRKVHEAVLAAKEAESGITIHFANDAFDEGEIIAQFKCDIETGDSVSDLERKIHELEHRHLPEVVEETILKG